MTNILGHSSEMMCRSSRTKSWTIFSSQWRTSSATDFGAMRCIFRSRDPQQVSHYPASAMALARFLVPKTAMVCIILTTGNPKSVRFTLHPLRLPCEGTSPPPSFSLPFPFSFLLYSPNPRRASFTKVSCTLAVMRKNYNL